MLYRVLLHDKVQNSQLHDSYKSDLGIPGTKNNLISSAILTFFAAKSHYSSPPSISQYFRPLVENPHLHFANVF